MGSSVVVVIMVVVVIVVVVVVVVLNVVVVGGTVVVVLIVVVVGDSVAVVPKHNAKIYMNLPMPMTQHVLDITMVSPRAVLCSACTSFTINCYRAIFVKNADIIGLLKGVEITFFKVIACLEAFL